MAKTRVHELAAEFGIESEKLTRLLADMDVHVRSHLSALDDDQVARVRARWEREKRRKPEPEKKKTTRRRKATVKKEDPDEPKRPVRRRRKAADVEAAKAQAEAEEREKEAAEEAKAAEEALAAEEAAVVEPVVDDTPAVEPAAEAPAEEPEPVAEPEPITEPEPEPAPIEVPEPVAEAPAVEPADDVPSSDEAIEESGDAATEIPPPPVVEKPAASGQVPKRVPRPVVRPVASAAPKPIASAAPGGAAEDRSADRKKRKRGKRKSVDREAVQANISRTLATIKKGKGKRKIRRDDEPSFREMEEQRRQEEKEAEKKLVRVNEFITVSELSDILKVPPTDIVTFCFKQLGMMVTVNQRLDFDQIELIASEFGFEATKEEEYASEEPVDEIQDAEEDLSSRPPVVTVMGHVDHGKTSLLDHIRKTNVIAGESGGITQHIGAYHVELSSGQVVTFLDTPGHQAFTAMRARGAQVTDLVVLVIAADDQVMPQTIEAISHAKTAGVPLVVAINKVDLPAANVEKVKQDLLQHEVVLEDFGGDVLSSAVSAKTGIGFDDLFEKILLQSEILDLKANPDREARGAVVESTLDAGKGPIATILVQAGTLHEGDDFICGNLAGRVRAMFDERGQRIEEAGPSVPVQVLGFEGVPQAGDQFTVLSTAQEARDIAQKRQRLDREAAHRRSTRGVSLEDLSRQIEAGETRALNIIIKADQGGPAEALADAFAQLSTSEVRVEVIHRGVGAISESDVMLAKASGAIIVGFHVRPDANARSLAERESVEVKTYRVIYEAVDEIRSALEGLLSPEQKEVVLGEAEVLQIFKISALGTIAGCIVRNGLIQRSARIRIVRDGVEIYEGQLASLKRFKEDVREVRDGLECGMSVENFNDIKVGDVLEAYTITEIARTLQSVESGD